MSAEKEAEFDEEEPSAESTADEKDFEEEAPKILKKRKRKGKFIMDTEPEADEEKLLDEITELLKRARFALANKNYLEAVRCYQDAAISANMAGDAERERIFLRRVNEILTEHPELKEEDGFKLIKKRKIKAKLKAEEKFSLVRFLSHLILAGILVLFVYLGLFGAIVLQEIFEEGGSYSIPALWGTSIVVLIVGLVIAYIYGTRFFDWSE